MPGHRPSFTKTSLWQMPHASTFTRTCPAPGSGISRSTNSHSPPALLICAAFIFNIVLSLPFLLSRTAEAPAIRHRTDLFPLPQNEQRLVLSKEAIEE